MAKVFAKNSKLGFLLFLAGVIVAAASTAGGALSESAGSVVEGEATVSDADAGKTVSALPQAAARIQLHCYSSAILLSAWGGAGCR